MYADLLFIIYSINTFHLPCIDQSICSEVKLATWREDEQLLQMISSPTSGCTALPSRSSTDWSSFLIALRDSIIFSAHALIDGPQRSNKNII